MRKLIQTHSMRPLLPLYQTKAQQKRKTKNSILEYIPSCPLKRLFTMIKWIYSRDSSVVQQMQLNKFHISLQHNGRGKKTFDEIKHSLIVKATKPLDREG